MTDADAAGTPPDFAAARDRVVEALVRFTRRLRAHGADVPAHATLDASRALVEVGFAEERARPALKATLVKSEADAAVFDEHFDDFWSALRDGIAATASGDADDPELRTPPQGISEHAAQAGEDGDGDEARDDPGQPGEFRVANATAQQGLAGDDESTATYSEAGDGDAVSSRPAATSLAERDVRRFERALAAVGGRHWAAGGTDRVDVRRALREGVSAGGSPASLPLQSPKETEFRCCLLVDVSRSVLDQVDRSFLLATLRRLQRDGRGVRTFFFDTGLEEVTDAVAEGSDRDPLAGLRDADLTWGGGTRIGDAIAELRDSHGDAVERRTVVVVVSDGLDVGDSDVLEDGMAWLHRRSRGVLWLNPLAASPSYEPVCEGMATALPYVDGLFAFTESGDLAEVARQLDRHGLHATIGYEYDPRR